MYAEGCNLSVHHSEQDTCEHCIRRCMAYHERINHTHQAKTIAALNSLGHDHTNNGRFQTLTESLSESLSECYIMRDTLMYCRPPLIPITLMDQRQHPETISHKDQGECKLSKCTFWNKCGKDNASD